MLEPNIPQRADCKQTRFCRLYASRFSSRARSLSTSSDATDDARHKHALSNNCHVCNGRRKIFFPTFTPLPPRPQISMLEGEVSPEKNLGWPSIHCPTTLKFRGAGSAGGWEEYFPSTVPEAGSFLEPKGILEAQACGDAGSAGMWEEYLPSEPVFKATPSIPKPKPW